MDSHDAKWMGRSISQSPLHEVNDPAGDPQHAGKKAGMLASMAKPLKELGDPNPLTVKNPKPKKAIYDPSKRSMDVWQPRWIRDKYFGGRADPDHGPRRK